MTRDTYPILSDLMTHLEDAGFMHTTLTSQRNRAIITFSDEVNNHYVLKLMPSSCKNGDRVDIQAFDITPSEFMTVTSATKHSFSLLDTMTSVQGKDETDITIMLVDGQLNWDSWSWASSGIHDMGLGDLHKALERFHEFEWNDLWKKSKRGFPDLDEDTYDMLMNLFGGTGIALHQSVKLYRKYAPIFNQEDGQGAQPIELTYEGNGQTIDHLRMLRVEGRLIIEDTDQYYTGIMEGETLRDTKFFNNI